MNAPPPPILPQPTPVPTTTPSPVAGSTTSTSVPTSMPSFSPSQLTAMVGFWLSVAYIGALIAAKTAWRKDRLPPVDREPPRVDPLILWVGAAVMFAGQFAILNILLRPLQARFADSPLLDEVTMLVLIASYAFGAGAMLIVHRSHDWRELRAMGVARLFDGVDLYRAAMAALVAIPLTNAALYLTQGLWQALDYQTESVHQLLRVMGQDSGQPLTLLLTVLVACVFAPVFEELMFRGHLQTAIATRFPTWRWLPNLATSIVFAAVHEAWSIPPIFVFSLLLGYVYGRTGSLWTAILLHVAFNSTSTALFLLGSTLEKT